MENKDDVIDDIKTLSEGFKLLQYDYLGGSGSRGYGKVKFADVYADIRGEILFMNTFFYIFKK